MLIKHLVGFKKTYIVVYMFFFMLFVICWFISLYTTNRIIIVPYEHSIVDQVEDVEIRAHEFILYIEAQRIDSNIIIVTAHDDASVAFSSVLEQYFYSIGLNNSLTGKFRYAYIAIIDGGAVVFEGIDEDFISHSVRIKQTRIEVESAGLNAMRRGHRGASVLINDNEYSLGKRGLNVVVFNMMINEVVDSVNIDTHYGLSMIKASSVPIFNDEMEISRIRRLWFGFGQVTFLFAGVVFLFILYFVKLNTKPSRSKRSIKECLITIKRNKRGFIIGIVTVALLPNIFLYYLYNVNHIRNNLFFSHSLFLTTLFAITGVLLFLLIFLFTNCKWSALIASFLFWFFFWFYAFMYEQIVRFSVILPSTVFFSIILMFIVLIVLLLYIYGPISSIDESIFTVVCFVIITLFLVNFSPAIYHEVRVFNNTANRHLLNDDAGVFNLNRNFVVDCSALIFTGFISTTHHTIY